MKTRTLAVIVFTPLYFSLAISLSHADAYIDMLENEAQDVAVDRATLQTISKTNKLSNNTSSVIPTIIPAHLKNHKFKAYLMDNLYETYIQFNELNYIKKQLVYKQYLKMDLPNLNEIKTLIKNNS